jgi:hypothetical protein
MSQEMAIKHLAQAEQMVALGLKHTVDQELRIRRLHGDDLDQAQRLLQTFKETQVLHEEHRDRLRRELGL